MTCLMLKNIAEIGLISADFIIIDVDLPAAERAIYIDLDRFLQTLDMKIRRKIKKSSSDREKRRAKSLGDSRCGFIDIEALVSQV